MSLDPLTPLPLLTAHIPGIGGRVREEPEDFEVEEIPAYAPSGQGHFLFLWIEKRNTGAEYFLRQVARRLELAPGEVGSAGLKDRRAVTRQMISVPARAEPLLDRLSAENIKLLSVHRHQNKLRPGHLRGNRFRILIRDPDRGALDRLDEILALLAARGMPNYYGPQRFGREGETAKLGLALVRDPKRAIRQRFLRKLALSAVQALLFNDYLAERLSNGLLHRVLPGDVMAKRPAGALFKVEKVEEEQARLDHGETVITGPIFGRKTFPAAGEAALREDETLARAAITRTAFGQFGKLMQGTRRPLLAFPEHLRGEIEAAGLCLTFQLPAGSYATVLLAEIMKNAPLADETVS
jgi:tRNA pseudouridine13 synthase